MFQSKIAYLFLIELTIKNDRYKPYHGKNFHKTSTRHCP